MAVVKTHKDLDVWKASINLVKLVYGETEKFPPEEKFGLTSQIRRSCISIPSNIAEGATRKSKREFIQFLYIALASLSELETQLIISNDICMLDDFSLLDSKIDSIRRMLIGLIKYLDKK
jgi:four helix bundle protein